MPSKTDDSPGATSTAVSLGDAINASVRPVHIHLNKLIVMRLRLALPPHAPDAANYVQGLLHIAPIYLTFEALWRSVLEDASSTPERVKEGERDGEGKEEEEGKKEGEAATAKGEESCTRRICALLSHLHIAGLSRSEALRSDLAALTGWSDDALAEQMDEVAGESPALSEFLRHTRHAVAERPHVLVAYAWVLYLALFAGGRFIRATLERVDPGSGFWRPLADSEGDGGDVENEGEAGPTTGPATGVVERLRIWVTGTNTGVGEEKKQGGGGIQRRGGESREQPLRFFRFDTESDGEDLKVLFKTRVAESTTISNPGSSSSTPPAPEDKLEEGGGEEEQKQGKHPPLYLTQAERDDVVYEARSIFEYMIRVVGELDEVCGTEYEEGVVDGGGNGRSGRPLSLRSRDSVVVEKEKRRRLAALAAATATAKPRPGEGARDEGEKMATAKGGKRGAGGKGAVRFEA
ncbi:hypothetical protein AAE478_005008 [Parahypoxylon ruwenzoriense]